MTTVRTLIRESARRLQLELELLLMPSPSASCECGKSVVFVYPKTTFTCDRCGSKYKLEIKITQTRKPTEDID